MGLILDSCIFIAEERGRFDWAGFTSAYAGEDGRMSSVTASELLQGVHRANSEERRLKRLNTVRRQMRLVPMLSFGYAEAEVHAGIVADLESRGCMIGAYDSMIAATALAHDWAVATLNLAEFQRVPSLKIVDATPWLVN